MAEESGGWETINGFPQGKPFVMVQTGYNGNKLDRAHR